MCDEVKQKLSIAQQFRHTVSKDTHMHSCKIDKTNRENNKT